MPSPGNTWEWRRDYVTRCHTAVWILKYCRDLFQYIFHNDRWIVVGLMNALDE